MSGLNQAQLKPNHHHQAATIISSTARSTGPERPRSFQLSITEKVTTSFPQLLHSEKAIRFQYIHVQTTSPLTRDLIQNVTVLRKRKEILVCAL